MRILVLSDSHGDPVGVKKIIASQKAAEHVIFCGDGEGDLEGAKLMFPEKTFYMVRGNCDFGSRLPVVQTFPLGGKKLMLAHGHTYYVKQTDSDLLFAARGAGADIVLFGHTHIPRVDYEDGLHIVNPGSCHGSFGTYAVIDLTPVGIVPVIMKREILG